MSAEDPFATLARRHADQRPDWRLSGANTAPIDFGIESLSQTGVLERKLVGWLQQELSLPSLTWRTPLTELGIDSLKSSPS